MGASFDERPPLRIPADDGFGTVRPRSLRDLVWDLIGVAHMLIGAARGLKNALDRTKRKIRR